MELGELLYNKSEYIETVRVFRPLPFLFRACVPPKLVSPSCPCRTPGPEITYSHLVNGPALLFIPCMAGLGFFFTYSLFPKDKMPSRKQDKSHPP